MCLIFPIDFINNQNTIKATSTHILLCKSMKWFLYDRNSVMKELWIEIHILDNTRNVIIFTIIQETFAKFGG